LISNETIKKSLLDIETLYKKMKSEEEHYRFDSEKAIYEPLYELMDIYPLVANYEYRVSGGSAGTDMPLSAAYFAEFLGSTKLKNGFVLTVLEFSKLNEQMREIRRKTQQLILQIEAEVRA
jgi:hypothetical protein